MGENKIKVCLHTAVKRYTIKNNEGESGCALMEE